MNFTNFRLSLALATLWVFAGATSILAQGAPSTSPLSKVEEEKALLSTLQSATSSPHEKVVACHRLSVIGSKAAVPVLAGLLGDEKQAHMARYVLEPMADPAAGAALRDALGKLKGSLLVGVINSIGFRRDAAATKELAALLAGSDEAVSTAAAAALGRIGTPEAAKLLQGALGRAKGPVQVAMADASLTCAEGLVAARKLREAVPIFDSMCGAAFPDYIRTAAMCGAITAREGEGVALLVKQLKGDDKALLAAAWRAARELPGTNATKALAAELKAMPEEKQVQLLQVLGDRGDKGALPAVLQAAEKGADKVRVVALQVLPRIDDGTSSLPVLLRKVTAGGSGAEAEAALAGLNQVGGADANAKILAALPTVPAAMRVKLIGVLANRRADNARGELLRLAAGSDAELAKASFRALAVIGRPENLSELIRLSIATRDDAVKVPADLAVYSVSMKVTPAEKRADAVVAALRSAKDAATKCSLLRPLGAIVKATGGSPQTIEVLKSAWGDSDAQVRTAALRGLADWPDATPALLLLDVFTNSADSTHRDLALRGGVRMAANVAAGRDKTKLDSLAWFVRANQAVRTAEEKMIIVSGLGSVKRIEGLKMLDPYLNDPGVQTEAALAVMELAPDLMTPEHAATLKSTLERIQKSTQDADVRRRAAKMAKSIQIKK